MDSREEMRRAAEGWMEEVRVGEKREEEERGVSNRAQRSGEDGTGHGWGKELWKRQEEGANEDVPVSQSQAGLWEPGQCWVWLGASTSSEVRRTCKLGRWPLPAPESEMGLSDTPTAHGQVSDDRPDGPGTTSP